MFFTLLIVLLITQRIFELFLAQRNGCYLKARGAYEVGQGHYNYIVLLHIFFFLGLIAEVSFSSREISNWALLPLVGFVLAQSLRIWTISTLGYYWNTRILILPGAKIINKGPYRYFRHPNYLVVILEFLFIPLIFQAYLTLVIFSTLNLIILAIRIRVEEKALVDATNYAEVFSRQHQFNPENN